MPAGQARAAPTPCRRRPPPRSLGPPRPHHRTTVPSRMKSRRDCRARLVKRDARADTLIFSRRRRPWSSASHLASAASTVASRFQSRYHCRGSRASRRSPIAITSTMHAYTSLSIAGVRTTENPREGRRAPRQESAGLATGGELAARAAPLQSVCPLPPSFPEGYSGCRYLYARGFSTPARRRFLQVWAAFKPTSVRDTRPLPCGWAGVAASRRTLRDCIRPSPGRLRRRPLGERTHGLYVRAAKRG
jgi:hypothetical protein